MVHQDFTQLDTILAPDLTYIHASGEKQNKTEFLKSLRSNQLQYIAIDPEKIDVRIYEAAAVITGKSRMRVLSHGKEQAFQIRYTDVYARRSGRWKLVAWQSTRLPDSRPLKHRVVALTLAKIAFPFRYKKGD